MLELTDAQCCWGPGFCGWGFLVSRLSRRPLGTQSAGLGLAAVVVVVAGREP